MKKITAEGLTPGMGVALIVVLVIWEKWGQTERLYILSA